MFKRFALVSTLALVAATAAFSNPIIKKWPPWISIEAPVNPFSQDARGAVLLVHAAFREGTAQLSDVTGSAEGLVNGVRRSVALRFETTSQPGTFALRRQWPTDGSWLARINLESTTALVTFDKAGNVASVRVPTHLSNEGQQLPRAVGAREIDSTLAMIGKQ